MQKRRLDEEELEKEDMERENIPLDKLYDICLKHSRLLLEDEFVSIFSTTYKYSTYFENYYEINLKAFLLDKHSAQPWIFEMDLPRKTPIYESYMEFRDFMADKRCSILLHHDNAESLLKTDLFDAFVSTDEKKKEMMVILKNIDTNCTIREFTEGLSGNQMVKEWRVSQHGISEGFKRTIYIRLEESIAYNDFKDNIKNAIPRGGILVEQYFLPKVLPFVRVSGKHLSDKYYIKKTENICRKILCEMSLLFGMEEITERVKAFESKLTEEEMPDLYILALRKIFNYCYYCKVKYGSPYELMFKCGIFHVRSRDCIDNTNGESLEKASTFYSLSRADHFRAMNKPIDIALFKKEPNKQNEYVCRYCDKRFSSLEFFEKHLEKKNHTEKKAYTELHKKFISTLSLLDYPVIEMIEQRGQLLPDYLYHYKTPEQKEKSLVFYGNLDKKYPILSLPPIGIVKSDNE